MFICGRSLANVTARTCRAGDWEFIPGCFQRAVTESDLCCNSFHRTEADRFVRGRSTAAITKTVTALPT